MDGFEVIGLRLDLVVLAWIACGFIVVTALLGVVAYVVKKKKTWGDPEVGWLVGASMTGGLGVIMWLVFVISLLPFQSLYHYWYGTTGTVVSVTNIFEGGSGEISPGYVVELDSVDAPLLFDDPRVLRADGERINVSCSVAWVPSGADRLNCWIAK